MFYFNRFMVHLDIVNGDTPHTSKYHKESLYEHVVAVAYHAAINCADRALFIAALLHDIGKPETVSVKPGKGATFYDHETHLDMVKEFLTEDDPDYNTVCDLIKYHMLPYKLSGPEPWKSFAEKTLLEVVHTHTASFMSKLFALHDYDVKGSFSKEAPFENVVSMMRRTIHVYADNLGILD